MKQKRYHVVRIILYSAIIINCTVPNKWLIHSTEQLSQSGNNDYYHDTLTRSIMRLDPILCRVTTQGKYVSSIISDGQYAIRCQLCTDSHFFQFFHIWDEFNRALLLLSLLGRGRRGEETTQQVVGVAVQMIFFRCSAGDVRQETAGFLRAEAAEGFLEKKENKIFWPL